MPPAAAPLFDRQRAALARLRKLVADRSTAEAAVAEAFASATAAADKEVARGRKAAGSNRVKHLADHGSGHGAAAADIAGRYEAEAAAAGGKKVNVRKRAVDEYTVALEKQRTDFADKKWSLDSQLEAWDKEARDRLDEAKRSAADADGRTAELWDGADRTLARVRLDREGIRFDASRLPAPTPTDPVGKVQKAVEDASHSADRLAAAPLPRLLGSVGTALCVVVAGGVGAGIAFGVGLDRGTGIGVILGSAVVGGLLLRVLLQVLAKREVRYRGQGLGVYLAEAERAVATLRAYAEGTHKKQVEENAQRHAAERTAADEKYQPRIAGLEEQLKEVLAKIDAQHTGHLAKLAASRDADAGEETRRYARDGAELTTKLDAEAAAVEAKYQEATRTATATRDRDFDTLSTAWQAGVREVSDTLRDLTQIGSDRFPPWKLLLTGNRPHPETVPTGVRYGSIGVDLAALPGGLSADTRLIPADPLKQTVPAFLPFPDKAAVLIKTRDEGRPAAVSLLQGAMLRFLTGVPPGKVRFTVFDPVGLGENFAAFMHLQEHDENLIGARIWTEPQQIEKRLLDLTEHMETVIQKYLRNQYKSVEEYNRAAGEVAEPYRVLVVANFPHNFTPEAARRLVSIMSSGPACGVCTLVSVDTKATLPRDFRLADLEQLAFNLKWDAGKFTPADPDLAAFPLTVDPPPAPEAVAALVRRVGEASRQAARVEVPFDFIAPARRWEGDAGKGFEVAVGRAGATRRQVFQLGKGTAQHALIAGKTGSGKSTLLHALIVNLCLTYSPDEAELYLIDFKEGVEFKPYAVHKLPHARVVAIQSEREFGLSVLQRLDGILRERGEAFRSAEVNDLSGYRDHVKGSGRKCPRILLVVDEFQMFFVEDDKLAQEAALLLDRLVRQGRAFGVHVLLGSQTLGGAYSIPRATIDQMAVRIALQCSEADAQLILSKENTAARLLNRPGEAIYNDANGRVEGNDPFQVVWLDEDQREKLLVELHQKAAGRSDPPPLVFEGNSSADLTTNRALAGGELAGPPTVWLGDAVAIKEPTAAVFRPQSAANLLLLGQQEEAALALHAAAIAALAARLRAPKSVTVLDGTPDDSDFAGYLRNVADAVGPAAVNVDRGDLAAALGDLSADLARRQAGDADRSPRFLIVHGLHRLRDLRKPEDDFGFGRKGEKVASPGEQFAALVREGPPVGLHVLAWCDTLTNLQRSIDRQGLREFSQRVLFQMSAADSSNLIDSPAANRLSKNRAFYMEEGAERPEKFRPYGLPAMSWLRKLGDRLTAPAVAVAPSPPAAAEPPATPAG